RRAGENRPVIAAPDVLVPDDRDRCAIRDRGLWTRHPGGDHVDLTRGQHLLALRTRRPPHTDVRLDLVEALERALDVARIGLLRGYAVGHQRFFDRVERMLAQGAASWNILHVPEIGP